MAYIFGQHLYSENRYSWIDEWSAQLPPQDLWFKSGCQPGAWDVQVCEPGVWQPVICGPVPPLDPPAPPLTAIQGRIRGEIRPIGSLHAKVDPPDAITGHITGSVIPVGSLQGTLTLPAVQGTITGVVRPVGSIHASQASEWVGILPQFGPAHHTSMTVSSITNPNDRIKVNFGSGTGQSLDRLPGGKVVWKIRVVQASGVDARLGMAEELAPGDPNLVYPPGFAEDGVTLNQDGGIYDGFPRPGVGVPFGTGSYILQGRDSAQGNWWVGTTDATGTNVVWHGDPLAGTGEAWKFPDPAAHAAVFGSSGDIFEFVPTVASEIPGRAPLGIHGVVHPVGSLHGLVAVPAIHGTITGVVRPAGSLHGLVTAPPWTPAALPSTVLKGWYDADDAASITASAGLVSQWNDKSGNGNHLTAVGTRQPTIATIGGKNVIDFNGTSNNLSKTAGTSLPDNSPGFTIVVIAQFDAVGGWLVFPTNTAASDYSWSFGRTGINQSGIRGYQGTPANGATFADSSTALQMLSGIATTTLRQIWQGGTSKATNTNADAANTAGRIYIGSDNNPGSFFDGKIAEIIILDGTDQTTREKAEGYAAWKRALQGSLDPAHPYKSAPPTL